MPADGLDRAAKPVSADAWAAMPRDGDRLALTASRPLPGAGSVAFHASKPVLAWAAGNTVQVLDLSSGQLKAIQADAGVSDLGFAPHGDLWIVAGRVERWHDDSAICTSGQTGMERLLGIDDKGVTAAQYTYSDGVGAIRHQVWLDEDCRLQHEARSPLPAGVTDADADVGGPPRRASLRSPHRLAAGSDWSIDNDRLRAGHGSVLVLPSRPVAVSADARWWVFGEPGHRMLWQLRDSK